MKFLVGLAGALAASGSIMALAQQAPQGQTAGKAISLAGIFTAAQLARGEKVYQANCIACHGAALSGSPGGPPVTGTIFRQRWDLQKGDALFAYLRERMPPGATGILDANAYADVMAYVLKANGAKAGDRELPGDPQQLARFSIAEVLPPAPAIESALAALARSGGATSARYDPPPQDAITRSVLAQRKVRLDKMRPVTDAMLRTPPEGDWLHWRNGYQANGFSSLAQINRTTVGRLTTAWSWTLPAGMNQITPLVHDGIMFVTSKGYVQALDAVTGDFLWQYAPKGQNAQMMRSLGIYGDILYHATSDNHVIALEARTGKVVWDKPLVPPGTTLRLTSGPLIAKGKVIQGLSGCHDSYPGGCFIVALDAKTGDELWRFYTLARPGQRGGDTWNDWPLEKRLGGSSWTPGSYDPDLDLIYMGVAQTYRAKTLLRTPDGKLNHADGLYTDSTLALRPDTGELVWHYQHVKGEVWDLDWAFERTLATLTIDGKKRKTVTTGGKTAVFDTLDAATGAYIRSYDTGLQNMFESINPKTGEKTFREAVLPKSDVSQFICPSIFGGRNWPATAFNPTTGTLFVPLVETCMEYKWLSADGDFDFQVPMKDRSGSDGLFGQVQAIDLASGKLLWKERRRAPQSSAILATGGGLVFEGSRDRFFRARDDRTGKILWETRLNAAPSAFPITYAVDGVQYVAVTAGGGSTFDTSTGKMTPENDPPPGAASTALWIFRLSDAKPPAVAKAVD